MHVKSVTVTYCLLPEACCHGDVSGEVHTHEHKVLCIYGLIHWQQRFMLMAMSEVETLTNYRGHIQHIQCPRPFLLTWSVYIVTLAQHVLWQAEARKLVVSV